jgi:trk system potassium uptake protein TrkA
LKIIVVGAGEVGFHIAGHLSHENKDVVVIDKDAQALQRVAEHLDVQVIQGSGSSPMVLQEADILNAEIILAVTDSDEINLVACLMADHLSPSTKKLARLRDADFDPYQGQLREQAPHIDTIINPEIEVVKTITGMINLPGAIDFADFADGCIKLIGVYLEKNCRLAGIKLADMPDKINTSAKPLIAAVVRKEELIIPGGNDRLMPGDLVYFISEDKTLKETMAVFDKPVQMINRVLIVGAGNIGYRLAQSLEKTALNCKIVEKNSDRCAMLAEGLDKSVVLCGDGSDQALLAEENVQDMDVVITLTSDEEINILASLLATQMGAKTSITRINKFSYLSLTKAIGIEQVVSPRLSAINTILQHIRRGKVISAISIKGGQAEVIEALALETSDIVNRPLRKINFPKGAIVAGIVRQDDIIIPSGDSMIQPDDRVIIFAHRQAIAKIEKILAVKLEYF